LKDDGEASTVDVALYVSCEDQAYTTLYTLP
jgi:hypothetical protein